jgi:epoxyqueuosine reductase QueG
VHGSSRWLAQGTQGASEASSPACLSPLTLCVAASCELEAKTGEWHITQEVCPWNSPKLVQLAGEADYRARAATSTSTSTSGDPVGVGSSRATSLPGTEAPSLVELMGMSYAEWDVWTRGSAIRRAGYAGFRRNVAVAMGNWLAAVDEPAQEAVAVLRDALEDEEPLVREHAAWALGQTDAT